MNQHYCRSSYLDFRDRDARLLKLQSQLFIAQRSRNKALCIQIKKEISRTH